MGVGPQLWSSVRTMCSLNCWVSPQAPLALLNFPFFLACSLFFLSSSISMLYLCLRQDLSLCSPGWPHSSTLPASASACWVCRCAPPAWLDLAFQQEMRIDIWGALLVQVKGNIWNHTPHPRLSPHPHPSCCLSCGEELASVEVPNLPEGPLVQQGLPYFYFPKASCSFSFPLPFAC